MTKALPPFTNFIIARSSFPLPQNPSFQNETRPLGLGGGKHLVVVWMRRISKVKNDCRMWFRSSTVGIWACKINSAIEVERSIWVDIDVQSLVICRSVENADITGLDKVVGDDDVLLIRGDFDVVRADGGLRFIGVIEAFHVVEVGDVESSDVVCCCEGYCQSLLAEDVGTKK